MTETDSNLEKIYLKKTIFFSQKNTGGGETNLNTNQKISNVFSSDETCRSLNVFTMSQLSPEFMVDFYDLVSPPPEPGMGPGQDQATHLITTANVAQQNSTITTKPHANGKTFLT